MTHTITTRLHVLFSIPGMPDDERESADPTVEIEYRYSPGCPAFTPRGEYAPIDPPDPAEVEFVSARLIEGDGLAPEPEQVDQWAQDWLDSDEGYRDACRNAESNSGPDPDAAYEARRDDADRVDGFDRDDLGESQDF